ncbi:hypothetical protein EON66_02875 [archaeon]|nr:MAG: hypothetical protein EON66_02875 [archaeon]
MAETVDGKRIWRLRSGQCAYECAPCLSQVAVDALPVSALKAEHFSATPDEVPGWQDMTKSALKRAMLDLRFAKLREERLRRRAVEREARASAGGGAGSAATGASGDDSTTANGAGDGEPVAVGVKRARPAALVNADSVGACARDDSNSFGSTADAVTSDNIAPCTSSAKRRMRDEAGVTGAAGGGVAFVRHGIRVVVDCSFDSYMTRNELVSLRKQLRYCYSANRSADEPLRLVFTSLSDTHLMDMAQVIAGFDAWKLHIFQRHFMKLFRPEPWMQAYAEKAATASGSSAASSGARSVERPLHASLPAQEVPVRALDARHRIVRDTVGHVSLTADACKSAYSEGEPGAAAYDPFDAFAMREEGEEDASILPLTPELTKSMKTWMPRGLNTVATAAQVVYLTADTDNIVEELDPACVYIVGGIIDRNRNKNLCARIAKENGVSMGKLPIDAYLRMATSQVLTTNQGACTCVVRSFFGWTAGTRVCITPRACALRRTFGCRARACVVQ